MTFGTRKNVFLSLTIRSGMVLALLAGMLSGLPLTAAHAAGAINLSTSTYSENFNTLVSGGTSTTAPNGWDFAEGGTNANTLYTAGTGSSNTGDTYSFGAAAATDRAFGGVQSGTLIPTFGAQFINNTGTTINSLAINYTGEEWRLGVAARTDQIDFQLSTNATTLTTGMWTDYNSLDFVTPDTATTGAKNGNAAADRTTISYTITGLNIANGSSFWIRWLDFNATGADDGLAVDDFSLTAGGLPTVTTDAATAVTTSGAMLNGTVNANGVSSTVTFEYGLTTAYGTPITAAQSPVTGLTNTAVSAAISGLTPNTTYHYLVIGVNAGGTTNGLDRTFSTGAIASAVTTTPATAVTFSGATLNGTVNANNDSTAVTFQYGLTATYGATAAASPSPVSGLTDTTVSAALSGLTSNTIYHYRVVGINSMGTTNGLDLTFTTPALSVSIITEVHTAANAPTTVAAVGDSLHARATITGSGPAATGSVTFFAFDNPSCSGTGTHAGMVGLAIGGVAEPSQSAVLTVNGLSFRAHYNGDSNYPSADGACQAVSTTSYPGVLTLSAFTNPQDGALLTISPSNLLVQFSMDVLHGNPLDNHSAENTANYLLVSPGANSAFDTSACGPVGVGGLKSDDTQITVNSVSYDPATFVATLTVNNGTALPGGVYRLFICGTTSITNPAGTTFLNNHTSDALVTFTIIAAQSAQQNVNDAVKSKSLPATGFAPNMVTLLPAQPSDQTYTDEDMWLEVPALHVEQLIVGVPGPNWDVTWLGNQIGYLQGTAFPTWNGNSALTGHVTDSDGKPGPFTSLGNLAWGDQIIIHAWGLQYIYEVRSVNLRTNPNSSSILTKHEEIPWLTLITCRGYDEETNTYRWRTVVRAVLVQVK